ncbi:pre-toxin TG domain-containing protein [Geobacillus icigianus]|uniref:Pre-toxin TG domain-containing protein n=1 Tax=Geobacillus subterraneus TaxID=129338 RepID=A0A679FR76_9BACL|nr:MULTISPECIES: pre-toxin TG domain-containing protein [Geobacillus]KYD24871.1 hypothetical protein B4113_2120 [Geobacillus sp. B4113_201601]BBW98613.1 hypothetical protein GsuE55_34460 [Geobacillus subterraneus]
MIRLKPDELETVAKHIPDAKDACERARTTLSRELSSLAMDLPGVSTPAIEALRDELVHWLKRYEDKLNEAEELLYRTAAAMHQADETLADNMKEFGLELLGWYDVQRVFGEYDPITGERLSAGDRLLAGGMLLLSIVPPAKSAGVAGKAAIKGAKAIAASALAKVKHVVRDDTMKTIFQTTYHQVIKAPFAETARLFKTQWDEVVESVTSVSWQPAYAGVGPAPRVWMGEAKDATLNMMKKIEGEMVNKAAEEFKLSPISTKGFGETLKRTFQVGNTKLEINSGHGYRSSGHRTGNSRDVGTMDEIESIILRDIDNAIQSGANFPNVPKSVERIVQVNGRKVGYSVTQTPDGMVRVSTYYPK